MLLTKQVLSIHTQEYHPDKRLSQFPKHYKICISESKFLKHYFSNTTNKLVFQSRGHIKVVYSVIDKFEEEKCQVQLS